MSTETADIRFADIDRWPTHAAVEAMFEGQLAALASLQGQVGAIAAASDAAAIRLRDGGRIVYAGAGTSGRVAIQDGVELTPTYDWPRDRLLFLMAGGADALLTSAEGAEDDAEAGRRTVAEAGIDVRDVVIGVAASGRTPYTLAVVTRAREAGALSIAVLNNVDAPLAAAAEHAIVAATGAELIAGSTRMKAGTAQKAALNLLSTAIMLRSGLVHRGLMVNMRISNDKLLRRGQAMVADIAGVDPAEAAGALDAARLDIKRAVLIARGLDADAAAVLLARHHADLHQALEALPHD